MHMGAGPCPLLTVLFRMIPRFLLTRSVRECATPTAPGIRRRRSEPAHGCPARLTQPPTPKTTPHWTTTDLEPEPDRSRCGVRPISRRRCTDLGAEFDRPRRGQASALALPIGAIRVWSHAVLWGRLVGPIRHMEMSHSGLVRLPAKKVGDKTPREFESPHLRSPPHSRAHRVATVAFGFCPRSLFSAPIHVRAVISVGRAGTVPCARQLPSPH